MSTRAVGDFSRTTWRRFDLTDLDDGPLMKALELLERVRNGEDVARGGHGAVNYPPSPLLQEIHDFLQNLVCAICKKSRLDRHDHVFSGGRK